MNLHRTIDTMTRPRSGSRAILPPATRDRMARILRTLAGATPTSQVELVHRTPFELLVATILSAQSTDAMVNRVTPTLFQRYREPADFARAPVARLERLIRPTGFYRAKARNLIACARALLARFQGIVPRTMDELVSLPGVGRKTANVVLGNAFAVPAVVVDTHVRRVANRLGFTASTDPDRIEQDLQHLIPRRQWTTGSQALLLHGRYVCTARAPHCDRCRINRDCPWEGKTHR